MAGNGRVPRQYSAERTWRTAGVAGVGSLVALVGVAAFGSAPHQRSAAAAAAAFAPVAPVDIVLADAAVLQTVPLVAPVATPVANVGAACTNTYTVRSGDYWIRIADSTSVPLEQLLTLNQATTKTMLHPAQTLCLPDGATVQAPVTTVKRAATTVKKVVHTAPKPAPVKKKVTASHQS